MLELKSRSLFTATITATLAGLVLGMAACGHKAAPPVPPTTAEAPTPTAPAPTIKVSASPNAVERGGQATLTWTSQNAARVELNGTAVNLNDSQAVTPTQSTDYQMTAHGADGQTATAAVHVTVTEPPAPATAPPSSVENIGADQLFTQNVRDAFFDYDKADIRPDAEPALQADAQFLKAHPEISISVEGHCDDRGSAEYNLALGDRRAQAVKSYLVAQGVDAGRIQTVSDGKEKPFCTDETDNCWQQNRRGHILKTP